jgi:hypothetical protein
MTETLVAAPLAALPAPFAELEAVLEWALPTERERYGKRLASSMEEMQRFYDAVLPRAAEAKVYLDQFELNTMPEDAQRLMWILFSLIVVSYPIDVFGRPRVPDSGSVYVDRDSEPATFPV